MKQEEEKAIGVPEKEARHSLPGWPNGTLLLL
jgi:hypothetical protein